jgi:hypothetical protein
VTPLLPVGVAEIVGSAVFDEEREAVPEYV